MANLIEQAIACDDGEISLARSTTQCADRAESLDFLRPNDYI
jgi:hypothetical protein